MLQSQIGKLINHPELLNEDTLFELRSVVAHYPFFQSAKLLLLKNLFILHDGLFRKELGKNAIFITDRSILYEMVEKTGQDMCFKYNDHEDKSDRTLSLIDNFLQSNGIRESSLLPSDSSTDYLLYMEQQQEEEGATTTNKSERTLTIIDRFLSESDEIPLITFKDITHALTQEQKKEQKKEKEEEKEEEETVNPIVTENLAKILISQQKYSRALEIIKQLYLQNPQKNCYFADQIRFLEKLIINDKNKL